MRLNQTNSAILRFGLMANAIFSTVCAGILLISNDQLTTVIFSQDQIWFNRSSKTFLLSLGIGLAIFAAYVAFRGLQSILSKRDIKFIVLGDIVWVGFSGVIILQGRDYLTDIGIWIICVIALAVLFFALLQALGLKIVYQGISQVHISRSNGDLSLKATRSVNADAATAWKIMTEHEAYADVADNLAKVQVLSGDGLGMVRQCTSVKGEQWTEKSHVWDPEKKFGFTVDTKDANYPYPLDELSGVWLIESRKDNLCVLNMNFNISPTNNVKGKIFGFLMSSLFAPGADRLLGRWAEKMEAAVKK